LASLFLPLLPLSGNAALNDELEALAEAQMREQDEKEERDRQMVYSNIEGMLKKRGGGMSFMGGKAWQDRYVVVRSGLLKYFKNEDDARYSEVQGNKLKSLKKDVINLRCYTIDDCKGDPTRFSLVPNHYAFVAFSTNAGKNVPVPDRVFEFEAPEEATKVKWVDALRGRPRFQQKLMNAEAEAKERSAFQKMKPAPPPDPAPDAPPDPEGSEYDADEDEEGEEEE
jgi:hypothetical protein